MDTPRFTLIAFFCMLVLACGQAQEDNSATSDVELREPLINANKARLKMEDHKIRSYVERHNWDIEETGTGLRYMIYAKGEGAKAAAGQTAIINYQVSLLDGTECYSSDIDGTRGFTVGKAEIEKGIDEGILLMRVGEKSKFILPSHLAHGLAGDGNKIPSHAVLIYDVTLIDIK